jgi:hypothetical protein
VVQGKCEWWGAVVVQGKCEWWGQWWFKGSTGKDRPVTRDNKNNNNNNNNNKTSEVLT